MLSIVAPLFVTIHLVFVLVCFRLFHHWKDVALLVEGGSFTGGASESTFSYVMVVLPGMISIYLYFMLCEIWRDYNFSLSVYYFILLSKTLYLVSTIYCLVIFWEVYTSPLLLQ